jgi:DNA-binding GntR family transcriptional regulator
MTAYQRIADSLRQQILSGQWPPGQRLPTERSLCRQFAVSQITIRRALQILQQEHLVARRQGSGTFASSTALRKIPILNTDFFGSISRHAPSLQRCLHSLQSKKIDAELASLLQICQGDVVLKAIRVDSLRGTPVTMDEVAVPARYGDRLSKDDFAELDFIARWQAIQKIRLGYCMQSIEAVKAEPPVNRLLRVRAGNPLLKETSVVFLASGLPAGLFVSYYRHDSFRFDVTFSFDSRVGVVMKAGAKKRRDAQ